MKADRLYYQDSHLFDFTAQVVSTKPHDENLYAVTLDRTAFYPTGGGQPHDVGVIENLRVVDCLNAGDNQPTDANDEASASADDILHIIEADESEIAKLTLNANVACQINQARRLDHIQQHTAQHILSRAFLNLYEAPTQGFRIMPTYAEVDIKLDDASDKRITAALELANKIVWENRQVVIHYMTAEELNARGVRSRFERAGTLRVVEIADFDFNPCGGTHAKHTGEVGVIFVPTWERAKGLIRLTFVAGRRAVDDYRSVNESARATAKLFSCARDEIAEATKRLQDEHKNLQRRTRELEEIAAGVEAEKLIETATRDINAARIIIKVFNVREKDAAAIRTLAQAIVKRPHTVALLATFDDANARFVFARAGDLTLDMNQMMRELCTRLDGKGGGTSELAQGGGTAVENLESLIDECARRFCNA